MIAPIGPIEAVFVLLVVATALSYLARRFRVAEPILLLFGGVVLGLLPAIPRITLEPDLVFLLFLPPILFAAAYFTPIRDFKANARPILLLAIGLVLFTTVIVAAVAHALIPDMAWPVALTLGAIVAPPDAVAATAVLQRLGVPRRVVTILEGESLINDASALIVYRTAIAFVVTGSLSLVVAGAQFVAVSVGGLIVGAIVGSIVTRMLNKTGDPTLEVIVTLIAPIASYLAAEQVGASGVLATVVAGLMTGRRGARVLSPDARLMGRGVWQTVIWAINSFVFMLIGLQLPTIWAALSDWAPGELIALGVAVAGATIVARFLWVFPATYLPRYVSSTLRTFDSPPPWRAVFLVSWAGMRGVVSLAAALALPQDFPHRDLILFLTFCVILGTLVGQGLTLPLIVRRLGIVVVDSADAEEAQARLAAVEAALARLEELRESYPDHLPLIDQMRDGFDHEASHVWPHAEEPADEAERELIDHRAIRLEVVAVQRDAVIRLRDDGIINDATLRRIERDLDLEALRAGV